jgi:TPR repeat protein
MGEVSYGIYLRNGLGVAIDCREAARYFGKVSCRTHAYGSFTYEICLFEGKGISENQEKVFRRCEVLAK